MPFYCDKRSAGICVVRGSKKILNVFQRIRLRFFRACDLASARVSFASQRKITRTDSWLLLVFLCCYFGWSSFWSCFWLWLCFWLYLWLSLCLRYGRAHCGFRRCAFRWSRLRMCEFFWSGLHRRSLLAVAPRPTLQRLPFSELSLKFVRRGCFIHFRNHIAAVDPHLIEL